MNQTGTQEESARAAARAAAALSEALDLEAKIRMQGKTVTPALQHQWAEIGDMLMNPDTTLHKDLISDIEIHDIPLDPRFIDRFI